MRRLVESVSRSKTQAYTGICQLPSASDDAQAGKRMTKRNPFAVCILFCAFLECRIQERESSLAQHIFVVNRCIDVLKNAGLVDVDTNNVAGVGADNSPGAGVAG